MIRVDARGLKCPWPALRAARALREDKEVEVVADDPAAERELATIASAQGIGFVRVGPQVFRLGGGHVNGSFTDPA